MIPKYSHTRFIIKEYNKINIKYPHLIKKANKEIKHSKKVHIVKNVIIAFLLLSLILL